MPDVSPETSVSAAGVPFTAFSAAHFANHSPSCVVMFAGGAVAPTSEALHPHKNAAKEKGGNRLTLGIQLIDVIGTFSVRVRRL